MIWPSDRTVEIEELVLRVAADDAGLDRAAAAELGRAVAEILARELELREVYDVPAGIALRVRVAPGLSRDEMAQAIAGQVLEALS